MLEFLILTGLIFIFWFGYHQLNKWRRTKFDAYVENIRDNIRRMPAETWILNGEYAIQDVAMDATIANFNRTWFWDHDFKSMIVLYTENKT